MDYVTDIDANEEHAMDANEKIQTAASLEDLMDILSELERNGEVYDSSSLPLFGGPDIEDTSEVWSWDEDSVIVGAGFSDWEIVSRAELEERRAERDAQ